MRQTTLDQLFRAVLFAFLATLFFDAPARATGGGVSNPDYLDGGLLRSTDLAPLDRTYVLGKYIYMGKGKKVRGLKICLAVFDEEEDDPRAVRLSRKVLKPFKDRRIIDLTTKLIDCSAPKSQVALILDRTEFRALVHFMNKRFRLRLKN